MPPLAAPLAARCGDGGSAPIGPIGGGPVVRCAARAAAGRPLAGSAFSEPSGVPAWKTIPSLARIGTADRVIPPAGLTFMVQHASAHITDANAGHLSMISDPETVAQVMSKRPKRPADPQARAVLQNLPGSAGHCIAPTVHPSREVTGAAPDHHKDLLEPKWFICAFSETRML